MEIERKFEELRGKEEGAFMPHLYFGDPSPEFSLELAKTLVRGGADLLEIGIPFSDPIADGPVFTSSCERALAAGVTPADCIGAVERLRSEGVKIPIVVTTYFNIVFTRGIERFCEEVRGAGAQALIIPDLPLEESQELLSAAVRQELRVIFQIAPTTSEKRFRRIIQAASGFLYIINVEGVTGARGELLPSTLNLIRRVKGAAQVPVLAGFGVSKPEQAFQLVKHGADGVVVGSAIAERYSSSLEDPFSALPKIQEFVRKMKDACVEGLRARGLNPLKREV